jgi:hypothetical protein
MVGSGSLSTNRPERRRVSSIGTDPGGRNERSKPGRSCGFSRGFT